MESLKRFVFIILLYIMGEVQKRNYKLYTIQIKDANDQTAPQIVRREKVDGKTILFPIDGLEWNFDRIELSTYHSDAMDKDVENINVFLRDEDGEYKLSTAWTKLGINLINSLAGEEKIWKLNFSVSAKMAKDGKTYANIRVRNEWQLTNWKLNIYEQKALTDKIEKKNGEFVSNDYSALIEKLKSFIPEINTKSTKPHTIENLSIEDEESIEDLPF